MHLAKDNGSLTPLSTECLFEYSSERHPAEAINQGHLCPVHMNFSSRNWSDLRAEQVGWQGDWVGVIGVSLTSKNLPNQ